MERASGIEVPQRAEYIRVITAEMNRISSHLLWFGAFVLDLGGFTPLLYAFDDREQLLDLLEAITGSRLTYCYFRFGGVCCDIDDTFINGTRAFIKRMRERLVMYRNLVTDNVIIIKRLKDIGPISAEMCRRYGATGPVAAVPASTSMYADTNPIRFIQSLTLTSPFITSATAWPVYGQDGRDGTEPAHYRTGPGQTA